MQKFRFQYSKKINLQEHALSLPIPLSLQVCKQQVPKQACQRTQL